MPNVRDRNDNLSILTALRIGVAQLQLPVSDSYRKDDEDDNVSREFGLHAEN